ncbi:hypothetical protein JI435_443150 [Parastagonospora nodorum SN15]|uniref:Uncharacterized protein n=1 Tax=Phaeosphaeria nodorum (strain SN15 / ATCC MYA-4574 / FGSC 10173) TaxID=321614 RepID=A0A7U2FJK0_PHANO|nr:hypothetical protein HBH53_153620 [Parastagonospora nodorum]QRD04226.1 hypothetical protein JI435_443150 [Parastagonospora nodorum SN15]KAH4597460.1 hypothetical protein HBH82_222800 [Parastagonospora nodorum]KAH4999247.1 hypothetical protein HBI77_176970 [Parastagonospora nodorum]KAH5021456.1 hypothetical protein HBI75_161980 [Parastagonospora nodorum]
MKILSKVFKKITQMTTWPQQTHAINAVVERQVVRKSTRNAKDARRMGVCARILSVEVISKLICDADCYPTFRALAIYPNAL